MRERPKKGRRNTALSVTFCGLMAALGAGIMIAGGFLGVLTYAAPLIASACLIPVMHEFGKSRAWLAYIATAILSALISADKEEAFFYIFVGFYPIIRSFIQRIRPKLPRLLVKLGFFSVAVGAMYSLLCFVFRSEQVLSDLSELGALLTALFFAGLIAVLLVFDLLLKFAEAIYVKRLRPKLKFLE